MLERFQCCFCGGKITKADRAAVAFHLRGLWTNSPASQDIWAHSSCTNERFAPTLDPDLPFDTDIFADD